MTDVVVLGAGPAGCAVALGLQRLGASVQIISRPRGDTVEGVSPRTAQLLRQLGMWETFYACSTTTPRIGHWAGEQIAHGRECLVSRERFDAALARDLASAGIAITAAAVREVRRTSKSFRITADREELDADCVIDARGRRVRRSEQLGPRLVARIELHHPSAGVPCGSALIALDRGWGWVAGTGNGSHARLILQFVGCPRDSANFSKAALLAAVATVAPALSRALAGSTPVTTNSCRAAVARFSPPAQLPGMLRIGDASLSMDPLSGHGIYEALRDSQVAVAAINSYSNGVAWGPIAQFVNERAVEAWRRALETAAGFYSRQAEHSSMPFWKETAAAYAERAKDAAPVHSGPSRFEQRPVLNGTRIELRDVWVSTRWPRGVWHVNGRELHRRPGATLKAKG